MSVRRIAVTAVSIAMVTILVYLVRIPVAATGGFIHTGAIAEIFVAVAFGPIVGLVASGAGAAIADLIGGYGAFAPLTFLAHGVLGLIAGWLGWKRGWAGGIVGWIAGGLALIAVYFLGEATVYQLGTAAAAAEVIPNLLQVGVGIFGLILYDLVRRAYPQVDRLAEEVSFVER